MRFAGAAQLSGSERDSQPDLHLPGTPGAEHPAEVRGSKDAVWNIEVGAVEQVEDLPTELDLRGASERPRLGYREVDTGKAGTDHAVARRGAEGERGGQGKRRGVEPALRRTVISR